MDRLIKNITDHVMCVVRQGLSEKETREQVEWVVSRHIAAWIGEE